MNLIRSVRKDLILKEMNVFFSFIEKVKVNNSEYFAFGFYSNGDIFNKHYTTRETLRVLYDADDIDFWIIGDFYPDSSIKDIVIVPEQMIKKGTPNIIFKDKILTMLPIYLPGATVEEQANQIKQSFKTLPVEHLASTIEYLNDKEHRTTGTSW